MAVVSGDGWLSLRGRRRLGQAARRLEVQRRCRRGRGRQARQRLCLQPRRAPDDACSTATATSCAPGARASFTRPHGVHMAPDDTIWLTDDGDHTVRQCTLEGKVLLTLGVPGKPAPYMSGEPFHRCTHTALSPQGDDLRLRRLRQFARPQIHARRQVADVVGRARHRSRPVQHRRTTSAATPTAGSMSPTARTTASRCSTATASTRRSGTTCTAPRGLYMETGTRTPRFYIGEIGAGMAVNIRPAEYAGRGSASIRTRARCWRGSATRTAGLEPGQFISPHGIAVDSRGDIYVGEVSFTNWGNRYRAKGGQFPPGLRALQKLVKVD